MYFHIKYVGWDFCADLRLSVASLVRVKLSLLIYIQLWMCLKILQLLQKVTVRLDQVEEQMSTVGASTTDKPELSADTFS